MTNLNRVVRAIAAAFNADGVRSSQARKSVSLVRRRVFLPGSPGSGTAGEDERSHGR